MKHILSILIIAFTFSALNSQAVIKVEDSPCDGYNLNIDGAAQTENTACEYSTPGIVAGTTYNLLIEPEPSANLLNISTLDLITIQKGLIDGFDSDLDVYKADWDQDGVISTYDLVSMRSHILGITTNHIEEMHVVKVNQSIPTIDPFDIQVDYSTLDFTSADFVADEMQIVVFKIGDLRG